ncbi:MAG: hypothetical protein JSS14_27165 [Proteobacteria bacterium]|nr:hypothetical protein [Pseudomonadota bacterium]
MSDATVFVEQRFWALVLFSVVLPAAIFVTLFVRREFSKRAVLIFGLLLICLAAVDIVLLHALSVSARKTASLADDLVFASELRIALYILPAAFGTLGINMVSHVLMHYLKQKELRFEAHHASAAVPEIAVLPVLARPAAPMRRTRRGPKLSHRTHRRVSRPRTNVPAS